MTENEVVALLMDRLKSSPRLIGRLGVQTVSNGTFPLLAYCLVPPVGWPTRATSVHIWPYSDIDGGLSYGLFGFAASCRAASFADSRDVALELHNTLNRLNIDGGYSIVTMVRPTLPPKDSETGYYMTPVDIRVKTA